MSHVLSLIMVIALTYHMIQGVDLSRVSILYWLIIDYANYTVLSLCDDQGF